jgi:hypothetical protein
MKTMKIFVTFRVEQGSPPEPMFAFHAQSLDTAQTMLTRWARYQGMLPEEFGVEENPNFRESNVSIHDEYVDHYGSPPKQLCFYSFQSPNDSHPTIVECHVFPSKPNQKLVQSILVEVAEQQFDHRPHKIWTHMQSTDENRKPLFGLAAEDLSSGHFIIPIIQKSYL